MSDVNKKLIIISGGGTGGPSITPLALAAAYRRLDPAARFLFVGSDSDLEQLLFGESFRRLDAEYLSLPAGKWRRYFSWKNFRDIFKIAGAFFYSWRLCRRRHPDLIISAGSFASVPLVWAGHFQGVKILIHQQDIRPGLANRLMAPAADKLTVAFTKSLADYGDRAVVIGNPSEAATITETDRLQARQKFGLEPGRPFLFITGGGSGALALNQIFFEALWLLPADWQIIHQTGRGKGEGAPEKEGYKVFSSLDHGDFSALLSLADMVVSRAGLGIFTELALSAKPALVIPIPHSHQEDNAAFLEENQAAIVLNQEKLDGKKLADVLISLWQDAAQRQELSARIKKLLPADAAARGALIIKEMINPRPEDSPRL